MKVPAAELKSIVRKLSAVQSPRILFAGPKAYAVGETITMIAGLGFDLGRFAVDAQKFKEVVSRSDSDVDLELTDSKLRIKHKRSRIELPIITDVVIHKTTPPTFTNSFNTKDLMAMLQFVSQASEKSDQFSYAGVISVLSSSGRLTAAATDGKRVCIASGAPTTLGTGFLIPTPVLSVLKALSAPTIAISEDSSSIYFQSEDVLVVARRLAKAFPSIEKVVPATFNLKISVKAADMKSALGDVKPVIEESQRLCLTVSKDSVMLDTNGESGSGASACPAIQIDPDPFDEGLDYKLTVNHGFLADFFNACDGDVIIGVNNESSPLYLESNGKQLVMLTQKG